MRYFISEKMGILYFMSDGQMFGIPIRGDKIVDDDETFIVTEIEEKDMEEMNKIADLLESGE